jgi:muramoyltetrapeptide carboxypeptidase
MQLMPDRRSPRRKPRSLHPGDTVAIVAPASNIKRELLESGSRALREMGYQPVYEESIFDQDLYFAGAVERRVRELEEMFVRDDVKAIICARGGYGANYLLKALHWDNIAAHPKIFVGYSDISTLLTRLADDVGLVTFHGPMVTKDFAQAGGVDLASWHAAVGGATQWKLDLGHNSGVKGLANGAAHGILYGGCLSILVATLGTEHEIHTDGTILFIEDIAAKPYQIDRMLMHLKLAGKLDGVRGMIFGEMLDCRQSPDQTYTLEEIIQRVLADLNIPIAYGLRSGHVSKENITLPIGIRAALRVDGKNVALEFLEPATLPSAAAAYTVKS